MNIYLLFSLIPYSLFLLVLQLMDAFSLTRWGRLLMTTLAGMLCFVLSTLFFGLIPSWGNNIICVSVFQEIVKGSIILFMISRRRIALSGDATIYGASVGGGFAVAESLFMTWNHGAAGAWLILLENFDVAVLHIGCTSTLAQMLIMARNNTFGSKEWQKQLGLYFAFFLAIVVHYIHLLEPLPVLAMIILLSIYFTVSKWSLFRKNEKYIHNWVDDCINNEITLLANIKRGALGQTNAGKYLLTLKDQFEPETFFDMCCFVSEFLELSIAAKSNLLLKEAGLPVREIPESKARIAELRALRERIGKVGELALRPVIPMKDVDQWIVNELV